MERMTKTFSPGDRVVIDVDGAESPEGTVIGRDDRRWKARVEWDDGLTSWVFDSALVLVIRPEPCPNCGGQKCMGCVFREYDHDCRDALLAPRASRYEGEEP